MSFNLRSIKLRSARQRQAQTPVWRLLLFDDLHPRELYALLRLRSEVFVLEQKCLFQDIDDLDMQAMHLLGLQQGQLQAYARCFNAGIKFAEASFGRVVVRQSARRQGWGRALIEQAILAIHQVYGPQAIRIGAQKQLADFYAQHGFVDVGKPYDEDGLPHLEMLRQT